MPAAGATIFEREPETGLRYVDLFGVSQIMVQKGPHLETFEPARSAEWTPAIETEWWVMYRNGTALGQSPVVWTSEGGTVEATGDGDRVSLPAGGEIVLSRPIWPGTTVSVGGVEAELEPVADVFVRASFDDAVSGELSIRNEVPGRSPAIVAAVAGAIGLVCCAVVAGRRRRRSGASTQLVR